MISKKLIFLCGLTLGQAHVCPADEANLLIRRVQAHFTIQDDSSAYQEACQALQLHPRSEPLKAAYIRACARLGKEKEMLQAWNDYTAQFPEQALNRDLIEEMAWGVLNKAAHSSSLIMRQMSLLAALFSQDTKGIEILFQGLKDSNYAIRTLSVTLAGQLNDDKLVKQIKYLFKTEKTWVVRQKVIEAIGSMKIKELQPDLEALIASDETSPEDKAAAIISLINLLDQIERREIIRLVASPRSGLRLLACQAIARFQSMRDLDQLLILANDFQADVRLAALQSIGLLRPDDKIKDVVNVAEKGLNDPNYKVAISAAWLLTLYDPQRGMEVFKNYLNNDKKEISILASAALKSTGSYGSHLALQLFNSHPDPHVRLNLALGLAGQRIATKEVCIVLEDIMQNEKDKWSKREVGLFEAIVAKEKYKEEKSESSPETDDQLIRLEVLNLLAILKAPCAQAAIRHFLAERSWGISTTAAALLLTEGDELAIGLVEALLNDPQKKVRLQAALVLSLWSREESAIQALEQNYSGSDPEQKSRILEGLGRIGSMQSVPFLIQVLKEPSQTLRLIAALALIQCLNH